MSVTWTAGSSVSAMVSKVSSQIAPVPRVAPGSSRAQSGLSDTQREVMAGVSVSRPSLR